MNILVVEDERNLADAICHILNEAGYNAEATYDGRSGLTSAESGLYDAVVLDVMLPKMDGFQVVHELRRQGNSVPVLLLTARTSTTDKVEGLDAGADADASENSVEAYVSFLRKKVKHLGSKVQITTLRMLGYRLEVFENLGA